MNDDIYPEVIAQFYALSPQEKDALVRAIEAASTQIAGMAYGRAARTTGVAPHPSLYPGEDFLAQALAWQSVASISDTYMHDLKRAVTVFLLAWRTVHGSYEGIEHSLLRMLNQWAQARAEWKSEQIARVESGRALEDGTRAFLRDLDSGMYAHDARELDMSTLWVGIVPEESSNDECMDWAGTMVPYTQADMLPSMPAHPNCIHYKVVLRV